MKRNLFLLPVIFLVVLCLPTAIMLSRYYYLYLTERPCVKPVQYSLGTLDRRFKLEKAVATRELRTAARFWNTAYGQTLFTEVRDGGVRVNFVYDKRQELVNLSRAIAQEDIDIDAADAILNKESKKIDAAKAALKKKETALIARGKFTYADFEWMNRQNNELEKREENLEKNLLKLSARITAYNKQLAYISSEINRISISGEYYDTEGNKHIRIYMYWDIAELRSLLAHEFGHSLWLDHVSDQKSVMYKSSAQVNTPSAADMHELKKACTMDYWTFLRRKLDSE